MTANLSSALSSAFEVTEINGRGRGVRSLSYLIKGSVVYRGSPAIAVLYSDFVLQLCAGCFETSVELTICPSCKLFAICSSCQNDVLSCSVHPIECRWICSLAPSVREGETDYLRFVLRYCAMKKMSDEITDKINTLCTNTETQSTEFLDWCQSFASLFMSHFGTELGVVTDDLIQLMCIVRANSLGFPFDADTTLGWCLQTTVSMLNHNCAPNCAITASVMEKGKMEVRTLRALRAGEELTISYIDVYDPQNSTTKARQEAIYDRYRFVCDCSQCLPSG